MKRDVLTVFLASPGDLNPERKITREVVDRVNAVLSRRVGWHIELLGWEDTLPSYSRPQEVINKDVDSCDLFVGMVWRRWGQPTGKCCSGFHEEFLRARDRHEKSGTPEIWLFFKVIDRASLEDPGEQLQRVLAFKEEQIQRKELFFKEFPDSQAWDKTIYDQLLAYVLDLTAEGRESRPEKVVVVPSQVATPIQPLEREESRVSSSYPPELGLVVQKAGSYMAGDATAELGVCRRT